MSSYRGIASSHQSIEVQTWWTVEVVRCLSPVTLAESSAVVSWQQHGQQRILGVIVGTVVWRLEAAGITVRVYGASGGGSWGHGGVDGSSTSSRLGGRAGARGGSRGGRSRVARRSRCSGCGRGGRRRTSRGRGGPSRAARARGLGRVGTASTSWLM